MATPESAKRFLKLCGYNFDEKSFLDAAKKGDVIAVNGFLAARIDPNLKDDNDDTALTAAAGRGVTAAGWAAKNGQGNAVMALRAAEKMRKQ